MASYEEQEDLAIPGPRPHSWLELLDRGPSPGSVGPHCPRPSLGAPTLGSASTGVRWLEAWVSNSFHLQLTPATPLWAVWSWANCSISRWLSGLLCAMEIILQPTSPARGLNEIRVVPGEPWVAIGGCCCGPHAASLPHPQCGLASAAPPGSGEQRTCPVSEC